MDYYLIRGDQIIATLEGDGSVVALPLLGGGDAMSLMNEQHTTNLMDNLELTAAEALAALGIADLRDTMLKTVFIASNPVEQSADITGIAIYHLFDISDDYSLWQCDGQQVDLLQLHAVAWQEQPIETLGLLAIVETFGTAFYPTAVRTATGMTVQQALTRRDRIATYMENQGYDDTVALRVATTEHTQMNGIIVALGYTMTNLWNVMHG